MYILDGIQQRLVYVEGRRRYDACSTPADKGASQQLEPVVREVAVYREERVNGK